MSRITVQSLSKHYVGEDLFTDMSFEVVPGMRLAVAGPNGCGKSTLLKIIAGKVDADKGQVTLSKGAGLGYVAQELGHGDLDQRLLTWVLSALPSWSGFWLDWEGAVASNDQARIEKLSHRQAEFEARYGYNPEHKARAVLSGLGFSEESFNQKLESLSGGWRERAKLARVLLQGADILLLDEPTNHLDLEAVEWLENYLLNYRGALVFVVHDRVFLEKVGTHVLFISGGRSVLRKGSFSQFLAWEEETALHREREAAKLSAKIDSERDYIRRFRVKARKAAQAQSKLKKVEKLESELSKIRHEARAAKPGRNLNFRLPMPRRGDKAAVNAVDLEFHYGDGESVWKDLNFQIFRGRKIAIAGPNGAGKSTLLKLIMGRLLPTGGSVKTGTNTDIGYFSQHQTEILSPGNTVLGELRRLSDPSTNDEQLMGALGLFMLGQPYFERKVEGLSGGEKSRLLLASLFMAGSNFLILDEPTNHLDLESREGLIRALRDYEGTILAVAHDRYLLTEVVDEIWVLTDKGLRIFTDGFEEYDTWRRAENAAYSPGESRAVEARKLTKDEKRRQAELRNKLYRNLKPLKDKYLKLEAELEKALEEQSVLEDRLNDPGSYSDSSEALKLNKTYKEVSDWAEGLLEQLETLEREIETLNSESEGLS